jgi:hypothetical protein
MDFQDQVHELHNLIASYEYLFQKENIPVDMPIDKFENILCEHKDAFTDLVRIDRANLLKILYASLLDKDSVLTDIEKLKKQMDTIPWLKDKEKYESIWFDGLFAKKRIKRYR